jgi:hyaluronoglucosaminidase
MCHKHKIYFNVSKFEIIQNINDKFRGENLVILYDPGEFPSYISTEGSKQFLRNGGIPQLGNLSLHLNALRQVINENVPDIEFSGKCLLLKIKKKKKNKIG